MPFGQAVVPQRTIISELYHDNAQNILEKTAVSNMIGLLQQLNHISLYASEIFGDILNQTDKNAKRIKDVKSRLIDIEQKVPKVEEMFSDNAPSYFYDHPFTQREWQRRDPLHGLIFRRDRSSVGVNRRRNFAHTAPDFSVMDQFSASGPCSKNYSDPNFFMNEWLEAEKRKMEEEREKRKQRKERKKKKTKRKVKTKILAVQKKKYNEFGAEFEAKDPENVDNGDKNVLVKQYTLKGEDGIPVDVAPSSPPHSGGGSPRAVANAPPGGNKQNFALAPQHHQQQASYMNQNNGMDIGQAAQHGGGGGPGGSVANKMNQLKQLSPVIMMNSENGPPPPAFAGMGGGPPPIPGHMGGGGPPPVPGGPPAAPMHVQQQQPKRPLTGAEMAARSLAMTSPSQIPPAHIPPPVHIPQQQQRRQAPKQILPQMGMDFLSQIKSGKKLKNVDHEQVARAKPMDARSQLLTHLRGGATTLKHVSAEDKIKKKEQEVDRTVHAILQRRAFLADDSDEESDESWGSESD